MFNPNKLVKLETNALDYAMGVQIGQRDENGKVRLIVFFSKKLYGVELNYPIYDKEFLAIIQAIKEFKHYMLRTKFLVKVYMDYQNIAHFATTHKLSKRQVCYVEFLLDYDIEIIYWKGLENGRVDALSC